MIVNVETVRFLLRDQIAMTRGMPSPAYLDETMTGLVQAAMRGERSTYQVSANLKLTPTISRLPDGFIWTDWNLESE